MKILWTSKWVSEQERLEERAIITSHAIFTADGREKQGDLLLINGVAHSRENNEDFDEAINVGRDGCKMAD